MIQVRVNNDVPEALTAYRVQMMQRMGEAVEEIRDIIAVRATTEYMREFTPDEVVNPASRTLDAPLINRFRQNNPTPILRRLTGRLTASLLGERQGGLTPAFLAGGGFRTGEAIGPETIHELEVGANEVRLRFGSRTPYAAIHEYGGSANNARIPARPYLRPAMRDVEPIMPQLLDQRLNELAFELGLS